MSRFAVFLGAGASAAEGAPIQRDLFTSYFRAPPNPEDASPDERVAMFFSTVFGIDVRLAATGVRFPTFEEVLGMIDLASARGEALRQLPLDAHDEAHVDLREIRRSLVLVMADAIRRSVPNEASVHRQLIEGLTRENRLRQTTFISTNYDTLIDGAIEDFAIPRPERGLGSIVDYGFGDLVPRGDLPNREPRSFPLFKIHGSLNWLHCPVCTDLRISYGPDIVARLLDDPAMARCTRCEATRDPIIVPPTYYKDLSNVYLAVVWNRAARSLRDCTHMVFCGYSLPDADMHVKYLIKAAQVNRAVTGDELQISIVNGYAGKLSSEIQLETDRYSRFFGLDRVTNTGLSFADFANDPGAILGRARG
jgi:NAD-dependent SIR2 family protein deacetylase